MEKNPEEKEFEEKTKAATEKKNLEEKANFFDLAVTVESATQTETKQAPVFKQEDFCHEAAYDAFITGVVFARILKFEEVKGLKQFFEV